MQLRKRPIPHVDIGRIPTDAGAVCVLANGSPADHPKRLMASLRLVPSEYSAGESLSVRPYHGRPAFALPLFDNEVYDRGICSSKERNPRKSWPWGGCMGQKNKLTRSLAMTLASALVWPVLAGAQMTPPLKPLPPKKGTAALAAVTNATSVTAAVTGAPASSWVNLPNQPPCSITQTAARGTRYCSPTAP
jgi:hypothetical protein